MKFRKKVPIDAEQFWPNVQPWPEGVKARLSPIYPHREYDADRYYIDTLEGRAYAVMPGDWICTGTRGEKWPCKPDVFEEIYEAVE